MKRDEEGQVPGSASAKPPSGNVFEATTVIGEASALLQGERLARTVPQAASKPPPSLEPKPACDFELLADDQEVPADVLAELEEWSASSQPAPSYVGMLVDGRYLIESCIAQGGMSVVYRCRHVVIGKPLAMKIISADLVKAPDASERSLLEAKAASAIGNEHIIDIMDCGTLPDGSPYLVMELLQGRPLSALIESRQRMPLSRIVPIIVQVAEGLGAAHEAGIVHRDLKPENIFLVRRRSGEFVKILDFGVAKMLRSDGRRLTRAGCVVGTPHYMAPEQASGASIDQRGDIYALGVILYELATGHVPFDGHHYMDVLTKHLTEPPPPLEPPGGTPAVPREFEQIVHRCMAKRPDERFQTAGDLAIQLQHLQASSAEPPAVNAIQSLSGSSVPCAPSQNVIVPPKRLRLSSLAFAAAVGSLLLGSIWHLRRAVLVAEERRAVLPAAAASSAAQTAPAPPAEPPAAVPPQPAPPSSPPSSPPAGEPITVVELGAGKTVEIESRTRLSLRVDEASAAGPQSAAVSGAAQGAPAPKAAARAPSTASPRRAQPRPADELINPWPAAP